MHREINVKLVFHEMLWKKNFTAYPSLNVSHMEAYALLNSI